MARYTGPKTKISRSLGQPIFGPDKYFEKRKYPPGQHGLTKRRKQRSEYSIQLQEKQKAKYTYGVLERQFRRVFDEAHRRSGVTGEILLQLLEARLDNVVYRLGLANSRPGARQLVNHKHIAVNGKIVDIASYTLKPGDVIAVRNKSKENDSILSALGRKQERRFSWLEWNRDKMEGIYLNFPAFDQIPETINVQLIVELYSK